MSGEMLQVRGLQVQRGPKLAVRDVDLDLEPGQVTALLGANGAGKSSLVLAMSGVVRPAGGSICSGTVELVGKAPHVVRASGVAAVPRVTGCSPGCRSATTSTRRAHAVVRELTRSVDDALDLFPELAKRLPQRGSRSGGQSSRWSCWRRRWCRDPSSCSPTS